MAADAKAGDVTQDMEAFLRAAKYTLVKFTDMGSEMKEEAMDICITAVEKHTTDIEKCTQMIKDLMDKKFGAPWHVVVGRGFSYEVTYEAKNMLHIYVGGQTAVLLWKL